MQLLCVADVLQALLHMQQKLRVTRPRFGARLYKPQRQTDGKGLSCSGNPLRLPAAAADFVRTTVRAPVIPFVGNIVPLSK
jgi:hypothetical protein